MNEKALSQYQILLIRMSMPDELRNSLWNALDIHIWSTRDFVRTDYGTAKIDAFSRHLWFSYYKLPIDSRPNNGYKILAYIRERFFNYSWNEVYDFLEFLISIKGNPDLAKFINFVIEREMTGGHL